MKSNSRVLRGWRDFGVKATAVILTILLATQMVGTPAFASGALTNKQASEDIATTVDDTGVEPSGTEATDTTVPDEAAGAANEPAPADSTQATEEPVVETVESATEPATETPAADPAANAVLGTEPAPAPAVEQNQLASIKLILADGTSITLSKDGNKIDDDTNPVDVPVNEELKFTAQAAEGWQVDKVKTVIDGVETELTADANGEYKVAADKVTDALTVKVEASAVPAESQPTDEGEASGNIPPFNGSPIVHATPSSIQVTQKIIGNDAYSKQIQLDLNELPLLLDANCASAPNLSDGNTYDFAYARVGKTDVASVNYDAGTDQLYLGIDGNSLSGIVIDTEDSEQIVLWYETHVGEYPVEYVVKCDGEPVDDVSTVGSLVGRNSIRDGETLQFAFSPNEGYEIANVTATNGNVSGESGAYSLSSVTQETTVTIELAEKKTYNFTFHESSNTNFKGTNAAGETVEFSSSTQGGSFTYLRGDSISFTLKANMQNDGNSKALNKVTLSIGSYQNMALNIPTGNNLQVGASETTYLANGMVATVELIDLGYWEKRGPAGLVVLDSGYLPEFEVTVSKGSCDAVRGDITLSTNFKDAETQEVWAKDLVGTELTIAVHDGKSWIVGGGYEYKTLDPSKFEFATIHRDDTYVYVHVLPGFDADDVDLTVYVDGVVDDSYELIELNNLTNTQKASDARDDGCQYYIVIPESENGKDIRISVVATSEERQYAAAFEDYDGAPGTLDATYSVGDSISVDDGRDVYPT